MPIVRVVCRCSSALVVPGGRAVIGSSTSRKSSIIGDY